MQMPAAIATPGFKLAPNLLHDLMPVDEMMDAVELDHADENEIDRDDVIEQPRHDQNQDTCKDGDPRCEMCSGDDHDLNLLVELCGWGRMERRSGKKPGSIQRGTRALGSSRIRAFGNSFEGIASTIPLGGIVSPTYHNLVMPGLVPGIHV